MKKNLPLDLGEVYVVTGTDKTVTGKVIFDNESLIEVVDEDNVVHSFHKEKASYYKKDE